MTGKVIQQWGIIIRRTFQSLFDDMQIFLPKSKVCHEKVHAQDADHPERFDQAIWEAEKAYSRACFIMGMAGLEAFCNAILTEFQVHKVKDLPKEWLNRRQRKGDLKYWRFVDKVKIIPTLCNPKLAPPDDYFHVESEEFRCFSELVDIRNSIMHGRIEKPKVLITFQPNRRHFINDDFPENSWPVSKIPRDFTTFDYECANISHETILWVRGKLVEFLAGRISEKYLNEYKIQFLGEKFESEVS